MRQIVANARNVLLGGLAVGGLLAVPGLVSPADAYDGSAVVCAAEDIGGGKVFAVVSSGFFEEHACRALLHEYYDASSQITYTPTFSWSGSCKHDSRREIIKEQCFEDPRVITEQDWDEGEGNRGSDCLFVHADDELFVGQAFVKGECLSR